MGRRAIGLVLVAIVHVLGFLLLLSLAPETFRLVRPDIKNFTLLSISEKPAPKVAATSHAARRSAVVVPKPPAEIPPPPPSPLSMILMSSEQFRASDIANIRSERAEAGTGTAAAGDDEAKGSGEGPGGEKLYAADWYTEPTPAEMSFYLKGKRQAGWGMIACRTVANYRVEDCREIGESPTGSGLAGALRQAAWQFKIRPPRIGGKPMIGTWVKILFDFQVGVIKRPS